MPQPRQSKAVAKEGQGSSINEIPKILKEDVQTMFKRLLALITALCLLLGCAAAETAAPPETAVRQIGMKIFPFYLFSSQETWPEDLLRAYLTPEGAVPHLIFSPPAI